MAVLIGLFLFVTQAPLPGVVMTCLNDVCALNTPIAMFAIGVYLAQASVAKMVRRLGNYKVLLARLVLTPLVTVLLMCLLPAELMDMKLAILIAQACPVGSNVAVYAQLHDADYVYAVETVVVSVLCSVVTIPVVVALAQLLW